MEARGVFGLRRAHPAMRLLGIIAVCLGVGLLPATTLPASASAAPTSVTAAPAGADVTGNSPASLEFPLERVGDTGFDTWVHYETEDGTALAGSDYTAASGELDLPAGAAQGAIPVQALGAAGYAPDKQFGLKLLGAAGVGPTPSFGPPEPAPGGAITPKAIAVGDLNGDGRPDLVGPSNDAVVVYLNTTAPGATSTSLADPVTFPADAGRRDPIAVADLNGDGRPDVIVAGGGAGKPGVVSVLLNTTAPGAATPSFAAAEEFAVAESLRALAVADLNGDGRPDLVVSCGGLVAEVVVSALINTTEPGASGAGFASPYRLPGFSPSSTVRSLATADLNGDGRPDLVATQGAKNGIVSVLLDTTEPGAATPSFSARQEFPVGKDPLSVAAADVNGDGRADLLVANNSSGESNGTVSTLLNTTEPGARSVSFTPQRAFPVGLGPTFIEAADLNGDGRPDAVTFNASAILSVLLNTTEPGAATPSFSSPLGFRSETAPFQPAIADLNGDGRPDLIVTDNGAGTVSVLINTTAPGATAPAFASTQSFPTGCPMPEWATTADVNGDGRPDLLVADGENDTVSVLLDTTVPGSSTPAFTTPMAFAAGEDPWSVTSADVNGDGRPDVVTADHGSNAVSVLLDTTAPGAATPSFATQKDFAAGKAPWSLTTADVSGDGRPDLIVADESDDTASVLLDTTEPGATTPSFATRQAFAVGDGPVAVTTADLNGDGGPDILTADSADDTVSALLDTQYAASVTPASVTGTIHYAIPAASLGPGPLAFGEQQAGTSATRTVTLSDEGGEGLAIEGVTISGTGAGAFSQTSSCPASLAVGASCPISVTFSPAAAGAAGATLTVASDDPAGPTTLALSGTGTAPPSPPGPPTGTPPPGGGGNGGGGGEGAPVAARLRITGARELRPGPRCRRHCASPTLVVAGTIAAEARGTVGVEATAHVHGHRVSVAGRARIAAGRWRLRLRVPFAGRHPRAALLVTARFAGGAGVSAGRAGRRVAPRARHARSGRPTQ